MKEGVFLNALSWFMAVI